MKTYIVCLILLVAAVASAAEKRYTCHYLREYVIPTATSSTCKEVLYLHDNKVYRCTCSLIRKEKIKMATYLELQGILDLTTTGAAALRELVAVGALKAASIVLLGDDNVSPFDQTAGMHEKRVNWAIIVLKSYKTRSLIDEMYASVVLANSGATVSQIVNASNAAIQSNLNDIVDGFAIALGSPPT